MAKTPSTPNLSDMSAEDCLKVADTFLIDENYADALDMYAAALLVVRTSITRFRILSHRSAAFYALERYQEALEDAQEATKLLPLAGLRSGESEAVARRQGVAAFRLENYSVAQSAFETAHQLATLNHRNTKAYEDWLGKCREKTSPSHGAKPIVPSVPAKIDTKSASVSSIPSHKQPPKAPRYQYYQSEKFMTISILEPSVKPENLTVKMQVQRLSVTLRKEGVDFPVVSGRLYEEINVDNSKIQYKDEKVLIKLRKIRAYEWPELLSKEAISAPKPAPAKSVAVPTESQKTKEVSRPRPYASHRDWDSIEKNLESEVEKPEGDEAMNQLFKQIYANADEDTRRAMIKSYQTSGGTVLSTNWDEVAKKDYEEERSAPDGMEWKTWEGDKVAMKED